MIGDEKYFNNEDEAKKVLLTHLEKKYNKEFTLSNENSYKYVKSVGCYVLQTRFKDRDGLEADAILPETKSFAKMILTKGDAVVRDDTYSDVFYTKKTARAIEPLFEGIPFVKHFISLDESNYAEGDLSLSTDKYFQKSGTKYWLEIILPDGHEKDYYVKIINDLYQKLTTKQSNPFVLTVYANGVEIFGVYYLKSKHFYGEMSYDDVYKKTNMESTQAIPEDKYMTWDYRIQESHSWMDGDY